MQREALLPLSTDDVQLVFNEAIQITVPNNAKHHVSMLRHMVRIKSLLVIYVLLLRLRR
jgi:hypothetical protein